MGVRLLAENGYDPPIEMAETWEQLIGEEELSAPASPQAPPPRHLPVRHPPVARSADGRPQAQRARGDACPAAVYDDRRARYLPAIAPIRPMLLDDQVKLNDPGASQYIIDTLAQDGWNGLLRFYEGEVWRLRNRAGDDVRAAQGYAAAVRYPDAPADAWRWHGLMLSKAGPPGEARAALRAIWRWRPMRPTPPSSGRWIG